MWLLTIATLYIILLAKTNKTREGRQGTAADSKQISRDDFINTF